MSRIHLFEFHDLHWIPPFLRNDITEFIQFYYERSNAYSPIFNHIKITLNITRQTSIIDLCSGATGPIEQLRLFLNTHGYENITIKLTDLYPHIQKFSIISQKFPDQIVGHPIPIDARNVPKDMKGLLTMFTSFHHFKKNDALCILKNAVDNDLPIAIFEIPERSIWCASRAIIGGLLAPILLTPLMKPFSFRKIFFTYLIPVIPLLISWDGFISCLRTYSPKELNELILQVGSTRYHWETGKIFCRKGLYNITYLIGYKKMNN